MHIKRFILGDIRSNCYIVYKNNLAMVIDPGYDSDLVKTFLKDNQLDVEIIYATHGHFDHIGGIRGLKAIYPNALVIAPLLDQVFFDHTKGISYLNYTVGVDMFLDDQTNQKITFAGTDFYVIHTPGHSPGGTCLYSPGILFSGDTLFKETVGRTDLYLSSFEAIKNSISKKLYALPDDTICYPGHGFETTIGHEKENNGFVRMS